MLKRLSFALLCLPLLMSCEDAADKLFPMPQPVALPAESQRGANTFGCQLNGQVWEANNTSTLTGKVLTPNAHYQHGELRLDAFRRLQVAGPVANINLVAAHVTGPGVYPMALAPTETSAATLKSASGLVAYGTDARHIGTLTITRLDTAGAHPLVAGRFELRAALQAGATPSAEFPAALDLTQGRFDIQLSR